MEPVQYKGFVNHQITTDCFQVPQAASVTFRPISLWWQPHHLLSQAANFLLPSSGYALVIHLWKVLLLLYQKKTARAQWEWGKHRQFHCAASSKVLYLEHYVETKARSFTAVRDTLQWRGLCVFLPPTVALPSESQHRPHLWCWRGQIVQALAFQRESQGFGSRW